MVSQAWGWEEGVVHGAWPSGFWMHVSSEAYSALQARGACFLPVVSLDWHSLVAVLGGLTGYIYELSWMRAMCWKQRQVWVQASVQSCSQPERAKACVSWLSPLSLSWQTPGRTHAGPTGSRNLKGVSALIELTVCMHSECVWPSGWHGFEFVFTPVLLCAPGQVT